MLAAVVAGLLLRLAWVCWVSADPSQPLSDSAQHLSMADQFSRLQDYRIGDHLTAYHAPGYPFLLAPMALLSRVTGAFSLTFGAALVNVVAGTVSIAFVASLARSWIGDRAAGVAAWLLALAPGAIYLTAVALNETVHTAVVLGALVGLTALLQGRLEPRTSVLVGLGALVGYAILVRATGAILLVVAVLAARVVAGSWRSACRPAALLVVTAVAVVLPWTIRNGVQVGVWSPSANGAAFLCHGHGERAQAEEVDLSDDDIARCFVGTAYGPDPHEGRWYRDTILDAVDWAVAHPGEELDLTIDKTFALYADDSQALADAADFGERTVAGEVTTRRLDRLADAWHRLVLLLAVLALALSSRARRAWPLLVTVAGLTVAVWAGSVLDRYHHTIMAILTVFASATMVQMGRWASAGIRDREEVEDPAEEDSPLPVAEGVVQAADTAGRFTGPLRHPFLSFALAVAAGAAACSLAFDALSFASSTEWVYARGAWLLTAIGVAVGIVAAFLALADLLVLSRGTVAFRTGVRRLLALDAALVALSASFVIRHSSDFRFHDATAVPAVVLTVLGLGAMAVCLWLSDTLTHGYGIRVALDEERRKGFEPAD